MEPSGTVSACTRIPLQFIIAPEFTEGTEEKR